jgi:hypothetical protein
VVWEGGFVKIPPIPIIQCNLNKNRPLFPVFYPTEHPMQSVMAIASTKIYKRFTTP